MTRCAGGLLSINNGEGSDRPFTTQQSKHTHARLDLTMPRNSFIADPSIRVHAYIEGMYIRDLRYHRPAHHLLLSSIFHMFGRPPAFVFFMIPFKQTLPSFSIRTRCRPPPCLKTAQHRRLLLCFSRSNNPTDGYRRYYLPLPTSRTISTHCCCLLPFSGILGAWYTPAKRLPSSTKHHQAIQDATTLEGGAGTGGLATYRDHYHRPIIASRVSLLTFAEPLVQRAQAGVLWLCFFQNSLAAYKMCQNVPKCSRKPLLAR